MEEVCDTSSSEISKQMPVREEIACCAKPDPKHKKCCSDKEVNLKNKTEKMVFKTITFELDSVFINQVWTSKIYTPAVVNPAFATLDYGCDANTPPLYQLFCQFTLFG